MVIFLCVLLTIMKINEFLSDYFNCDIYNMFLNGYCLEYYKILESIYPDCKMVLQKNNDHCACLINDEVYDVSGLCDRDSFVIACKEDVDFIYSFYKKFDDGVKKDIKQGILGYIKVLK